MTNSDLAPDPPHNPLLRFDEEPLASPTASFEKAKPTCDFNILVSVGAVAKEVAVRDKRPLSVLIDLWLKACNRVEAKGHKVSMASHAMHAAMGKEFKGDEDPPEPPAWTLERDDLMIFEGDENGERSAAYPGDMIKGIARA